MLLCDLYFVITEPALCIFSARQYADESGSLDSRITESRDTKLHSTALWPPNSPDLSPVDYTVWSVMQGKVYQHWIKHVGELRECIVYAWDELDRRVICTAVRQWGTRLHVCIKVKGDYYEHNLR